MRGSRRISSWRQALMRSAMVRALVVGRGLAGAGLQLGTLVGSSPRSRRASVMLGACRAGAAARAARARRPAGLPRRLAASRRVDAVGVKNAFAQQPHLHLGERIAQRVGLALALRTVERVVVGERVRVGPDDMAVDKRGAVAGAAVRGGGLEGARRQASGRCRRSRQSGSWGNSRPGARCCRRAC